MSIKLLSKVALMPWQGVENQEVKGKEVRRERQGWCLILLNESGLAFRDGSANCISTSVFEHFPS